MRISMRANLEYTVTESQGKQVFFLKGAINENCKERLEELVEEAEDECFLNLKDVVYINSIGIKNWIGFLTELTRERKVGFIETSTAIIRQVNMIPEIAKGCRISDFYGDFVCEDCGYEETKLFHVSEGMQALIQKCENLVCPNCESELEMEETAEEFFSFISFHENQES